MKPNYLIEGTLNYQTDSTLSDCDSNGFWESGTVVPNCCGPNTGPQELDYVGLTFGHTLQF